MVPVREWRMVKVDDVASAIEGWPPNGSAWRSANPIALLSRLRLYRPWILPFWGHFGPYRCCIYLSELGRGVRNRLYCRLKLLTHIPHPRTRRAISNTALTNQSATAVGSGRRWWFGNRWIGRDQTARAELGPAARVSGIARSVVRYADQSRHNTTDGPNDPRPGMCIGGNSSISEQRHPPRHGAREGLFVCFSLAVSPNSGPRHPWLQHSSW